MPPDTPIGAFNKAVSEGGIAKVKELATKFKVPKIVGALGILPGVPSMARDIRIQQQGVQYAPWEFHDDGGAFVVEHQARGGILVWPFLSGGSKRYTSGPLTGATSELSNSQVRAFNTEGQKRWGYMDWKGDFVPGTERKSLPTTTYWIQ
jgi:hypothetical protein